MAPPVIHGIDGSPYVFAARLGLAEKGVPHRFAEMPMGAHRSPEHRERHPFGRIPVFEHDGFWLYETQAILRHVDEAFAGPPLQPEGAVERARMSQIIGIVDWYLFPGPTAAIAWERLMVPALGGTPDLAAVQAAVPALGLCLGEIARLMGGNRFLAGDRFSLADIHAFPQINYLALTPEGKDALAPHPRLAEWIARVAARPALAEARPKMLQAA
jgi:glutathione S-transferase